MDDVENPDAWAGNRSKDNSCAYGFIVYKTKSVLAEAMGLGSNCLQEVESRHNMVGACPTQIREGKLKF